MPLFKVATGTVEWIGLDESYEQAVLAAIDNAVNNDDPDVVSLGMIAEVCQLVEEPRYHDVISVLKRNGRHVEDAHATYPFPEAR